MNSLAFSFVKRTAARSFSSTPSSFAPLTLSLNVPHQVCFYLSEKMEKKCTLNELLSGLKELLWFIITMHFLCYFKWFAVAELSIYKTNTVVLEYFYWWSISCQHYNDRWRYGYYGRPRSSHCSIKARLGGIYSCWAFCWSQESFLLWWVCNHESKLYP